ncbi:MAG: hypothetical protein Q8R45_11235 [Brevundimonas sp.]|uniref:hypothetical protein n=1 Tax=Brevundimonas sp. TaxID=1871086 RepID=UPI002717604D|nr:hypothetical protein [Brevundimonas sp.]MDO9588758.1 hypothetical protein [Brevundimonas sp.]MDP3370109.1 hypothetical protein [Brevundimonas sp.]MDP3657526.1 hypothetical protein [Brevundimonas sp.]MDZ4108608.1 hypothetical protein [Brevundimonas sp.]
MRRFFIWSALAAVIGLALAGGGYWAYWNYYARFQPVTVTQNQAGIQRLLDESSWLSSGGGGEPLYIIGYRDSAAMQRYEREEAPKLRAAGVEVRIIVFARPDREGLAQSTAAERATVAELWLTRDFTLYQRWTATPVRNWTAAGIPAADGSLARGAVVDAGREFVDRLTGNLGQAGLRARYPLIIWRDREGFMKACACADSRSWVFIRDDLNAPDRLDPPGVAPADPAAPLTWPGDGSPESLPYPTLPPIAPADGQPVQDSDAAPAPARPATPPASRNAPEAKKSDDTTFF